MEFGFYQSVGDGVEEVGGFHPEGDVLPVAVDGQARLVVRPRQVVVVTSVEHGVRRLRRRHARKQVLLQPVAIVTDADLELDRRVDGADHRRVEERRVQPELATSLILLHAHGQPNTWTEVHQNPSKVICNGFSQS